MEVKAQAKYVRGSARKARVVVDAVRGMKALYALDYLKYMRRGAAPDVRKVVQSAVANAMNNFKLDPENLVVAEIMVDNAPMFKRGRAESKGRYRTILKRNNHLTVILKEAAAKPEVKVEKKAAAKPAKKAKSKTQTAEVAESE